MSERLQPNETIEIQRHSVPFVADFLEALRRDDIIFTDPQLFGQNKDTVLRYYSSLVLREAGDRTAILGHLLGVSNSPEQTKNILNHLASLLFDQLAGSDEHNSVTNILNGIKKPNIEDLKLIDDLTGFAVSHLKSLPIAVGLASEECDNMTPDAYKFRSNNRQIINDLIGEYGGLDNLLRRKSMYNSYGQLIDITQTPIVPVLSASPLLAILPPELNRIRDRNPLSAESPLGFISKLNSVGSDVIRSLITMAREEKFDLNMQDRISRMP